MVEEVGVEWPGQRRGLFMCVIGYQWMVCRQRIGEEDGIVERVGWIRFDGVGGENDQYENEGIEPCVSEREGLVSAEEALCFPSLGEGSEWFLGIALDTCQFTYSQN